jgi:hypothetical protein
VPAAIRSELQRTDRGAEQLRSVPPVDAGHVDVELQLVAVGDCYAKDL